MSWYNDSGELVPGRKPGTPNRSPYRLARPMPLRGGSEARVCRCGKEFRVEHNQLRTVKGAGTYCSASCKHDALRGKELKTGGRYVRRDGYVAVKVGIRKYELEHRLVMERELGRKLSTDEHVHHINGDKQDNRPENLDVMSNADHQRLHKHLFRRAA